MMNLFDLTGRTALITGSSGGLGLAMSQALSDAGAAIVLHGRNQDKLREAAAQFASRDVEVETLSFDVTCEADVHRAFESLDERGITIDILINNAGMQHRQPMVELSLADWQKVIDTNLSAAFLVGQQVARRLIEKGQGGKIINVGSLTSQVARATVAPYTAAKGGIRLLTCSMAAEWAEHNIQANAIGPGYMLTDMTRALSEDPTFDGWVKARTPSRRWGLPEDLASTVIYLAAPGSGYVNGQIIYVDGGMLAVL
ncbi:SDR family oxidoreductase [Kushneria marisflavi]|uniref:Gluconate 5-dehydrogenase n=1 Tax=Kushneria marisflavi TaxID=157779 RepID=A0A240UQ47_9GAMM|nr:SDR family oxidoreductase [Kushneria marisflavi]ART63140.1 gluconate 5-dehydrogenase [Kushneria marisflavi]RKD84604.1 gluconate 5-dehydrogenase [Kushneria marisflavi]